MKYPTLAHHRDFAHAIHGTDADGIMKKFRADLMQPEPEPTNDVSVGHVSVPAEYHDPVPADTHKPAAKTTPKSKKSNSGGKTKLKSCAPNRKPNCPPGQEEITRE